METININGMTEDEKREYVQSWVRDLDEFALEEILIEFCGFGDGNSPARHEPEPPTLRPMSELPEKKHYANFLLQSNNDNRSWQKGYIVDGVVFLNSGGGFAKDKDFKGIYGQIKGWLPALPNPNEIL